MSPELGIGIASVDEERGCSQLKVVCFECMKQIGEKAPFSDTEVTHTLCESCLRKTMERLRNKRRQEEEKQNPYHAAKD